MGALFSIRKRIFRGWFVLLGVMLLIFIAGTSLFGAFAVFLPVMCNEFGWSRGSVAGALSVGVLSFGLPSPLFGVMVARYGPRLNIIAGNLLAAVGVAGMFFVQEVWHVYLCYVLIGLGGGIGGYIAGTTVVNNWFVKKRSLALGMFIACGGLGGLVFPPLITALIAAVGWRATWLVLAGLFIVVVAVGGGFLIRNRPEEMGLKPDGTPAEAASRENNPEKAKEQGAAPTGWLQQAVRTPVTWFIIAMLFACAFISGTISTHQIAYLQDIGFSAMTAATVASFMAIFNTLGSLSMGALGLRFNIRYLAVGAILFQFAGLIMLSNARTLSMAYIYAACLGLGWSGILTALPTFISVNFPHERYAQVMGIIFPFNTLAQAISATLAGLVYDQTGQYRIMFLGLLGFSVIGLTCALMARRRQPLQPLRLSDKA
jgi:MFS family permease